MTLKLSDEQWGIIRSELPKGSELREKVTDLRDDAMTWGEAEEEFSAAEVQALNGLGLPWLDSLLLNGS